MRSTYGNHGNPIEDQYKYMKLRLKSKKAGHLKDTPENIALLETKIEEIRKKYNFGEVAVVVKKEETEQDVLRSKITKLENTLSNKKFLQNVSPIVKDLKEAELELLKDELKTAK